MKTITRTELENLYVTMQKTYKEISELTGRSVGVIRRLMNEYNISSRPPGHMKGKRLDDARVSKIRAALIGKPKTEAHKKKLSKSMSGCNNPNFGKKSNRHGKRHWYTCPNGQVVSMRSNWEVAYANWLNDQQINWRYEPVTFVLLDGRAYTPDFLLVETYEYVEVKGWLRKEHDDKMRQFRQENPNIKLILADKNFLTSLGIDLRKQWVSNKPTFPCKECGADFFKKYPHQQLCSIKCRNRFIANVGTISIEEKTIKRRYSGKQHGDQNNASKLSEIDVIDILQMRKDGHTLKDIAIQKGSTIGNVGNIVKGRSWKHIQR